MDSFTLLHVLRTAGHRVTALSVNYGQRHARELVMASLVCSRLGVPHTIVDASFLAALLPGSSQTDKSVDVPAGAYDAPVMKRTVVPNRNMILASMAAGHALALKAEGIALAVHAGDHAIYPDCRERFIHLLRDAIRAGNWDPNASEESDALADMFEVKTPFLNFTKGEILAAGKDIGLEPLSYMQTWTCYDPTPEGKPCGVCGACVERAEAFAFVGWHDPLL
jgi:7-cyano-7-deazaguanine synthase